VLRNRALQIDIYGPSFNLRCDTTKFVTLTEKSQFKSGQVRALIQQGDDAKSVLNFQYVQKAKAQTTTTTKRINLHRKHRTQVDSKANSQLCTAHDV